MHLEIQKTPQFNDYGGDRAPMLTSFCEYQAGLNPGGDEDPAHWDIGLLVSGVDFWADNGRGGRSYLTMGLATVTGVTLVLQKVASELHPKVRNHGEGPY